MSNRRRYRIPPTRRAARLSLRAMVSSSLFTAGISAPDDDYQSEIRPILQEYCFECHGEEKAKSGLRIDTLSTDLVQDRKAGEFWADIRHVLTKGEMPPDDAPQPSDEKRLKVLDWLTPALLEAAEKRRSVGGRVVLRRLNRPEYQYTLTDLFGLEYDYARDLPPDGKSPEGMTNNGSSLRMTGIQMEYYLAAARNALDKVLVHGSAPEIYRHSFSAPTENRWLRVDVASRLGRGRHFVVRMKDDYPEWGAFRVQVRATGEFPESGAIPRLRVWVGYRPDTQIEIEVLDEMDITKQGSHVYAFQGRIENFPLPVRGQGKFPGLVVSVENAHDEFSAPIKETIKNADGKEKKVYVNDSDYPYLNIESVTFEGPLYNAWPPKSYRNILPESPLRNTNEPAYARLVIERFLPRAWRQPVSNEQLDRFVQFFRDIRRDFDTFEGAIKETLAMALIAPQFLYLLEPDSQAPRKLNAVELASRLSYFLWSSMPDERLRNLARTGELLKPRKLKAEVHRMLEDPKAWRFVDQFTNQWLDLEAVDRMEINAKAYPDFDSRLKESLKNETRHYFAELLKNNLSAERLIDSDFVVVNAELARHYNMRNVRGGEFQRVSVHQTKTPERGGLLTQASLLLANSNGTDSNLIKRSVFLLDRILGDPPPPPPPNVPELKTADPDFARLPIRDQLALHREDPACADCHQGIDPWGQAMEGFDAIGLPRASITRRLADNPPLRLPVDTAGQLPNGDIHGMQSLKTYLLENHRDQFARAFVEKLVTYSLGRSLEFSDDAALETLTREFIENDLRIRELIQSVVASDLFQTK